MKKVKKLMLLTALCAIISCGGGGGGGSPAVSNIPAPVTPGSPTPVNPGPVTPPVVVNNTRYTTTPDITKLKEGLYDWDEYTQEGDNDSHNGHTTTIGAMKYGFELDKVGTTSIYPSTVMTVQRDGGAFWYDADGEIDRDDIEDVFDKITDPSNLTLNMVEGSNLLVVDNAIIKLSDSDFSNIISVIPALNSKIHGTGYNEVKFINSKLLIDEDINLDDDNNKYYKTLPKITPTKITLETNINITGTKDEQVAIKASNRVINWGTIKLTGKNTVALFSKKTIWNSGPIEVGENSIAQYIVYNNPSSDNENENRNIITLGKSSIGIRIDREYNNIGGEGINNNTGKIMSTAEKSIGIMAYTVDKPHSTGDTDHFKIHNHGEINLSGDISTGLYVTGKSSTKMYNNGEIIMGDSSDRNNPSIGMFSINPSNYGENGFFGFMKVGKNSIGMAGVNGGKLKNEGRIVITGDGGIGMYLADGTEGFNASTIETDGEGLKDVIGVIVGKDSKFTNETFGKILINSVNGKGIVFEKGAVVVNNGEIKVNGTDVSMEEVATKPVTVKAMSNRITPVKSDLGIYMNSLGKTNPIEGLSNLGLNSADLLIGAEATEKTNATEVAVSEDVIKPFNDSIQSSNIDNWTVKSGSLVWEAEPEIRDNNIEKVTLKKQSYAKYADEKTEEVAKALDEKYVNTMAESKDKQIFNDMNKLRTEKELAKTYKEVSGGQYINVQQRIYQTDEALDRELTGLKNDKLGQDGHHISTFVGKDEYKAKTPEVADSKNTDYGTAYLYNNTDNGWGIYAGAVMNKFKLEDTGKSKENMTLIKAGAYKKFDLGAVDWTVSGEGSISWNEMKRRYVSGGVAYENKADYNSYGLAVKNEVSRTHQISKNMTFKPYGALKIGFGKFTDIKEKNSTLGLEIKGNSYYSVKPIVGMELGLAVPVGTAVKFKAGLGLAYEHELGKIENNENEARFIGGGTSWKLKGAKDEDRGGLRSELKAGFEAGNFNIFLTGGYNTRGKNSHVGINFGASF